MESFNCRLLRLLLRLKVNAIEDCHRQAITNTYNHIRSKTIFDDSKGIKNYIIDLRTFVFKS